MADNKITRVFITAECILDYDYAILRTVFEKYNNPEYIDQTIFAKNEEETKTAIVNRKERCVLSLCVNDKVSKEDYEELCHKIYEEDYEIVDKYLSHTTLYDFVNALGTYRKENGYSVTIMCEDKRQYKSLVKSIEERNVFAIPDNIKFMINSYDKININDYDIFILKDIACIMLFNDKIKNKRVIALEYRFNTSFDNKMNKFIPNINYSIPLIMEGTLPILISVYKNISLTKQ